MIIIIIGCPKYRTTNNNLNSAPICDSKLYNVVM